jgi:HAD superfamily hydrolase (TIGR01509 family)
MRIEGAIFDLDGTLLDSMAIWDSVGSDYLRSRGIIPEPGLNTIFRNMSLYQAALYYQNVYGLKDSTDVIMAGVNAMIEDFYFQQAIAKIGVDEFLKSLKQQGTRMCIATATDRYLVEAALSRNHLLNYFEEIFTCTDVGHGKDEPHIYNAALDFLGTSKSSTYIFEDALYAVRTAKEAGFTVVGVQDAFEHNGEAVQKIADYYITNFYHAKDLLT